MEADINAVDGEAREEVCLSHLSVSNAGWILLQESDLRQHIARSVLSRYRYACCHVRTRV